MPRFPVTFRRKSTAAEDPNGPIAEHSFRVLERSEVSSGKSFDGGVRLARMTAAAPKPNIHSDLAAEDNLFAGLKNNRGSGSSNTTKTASDNSSRHSNASTAPSSTDFPQQEDWRNSSGRKHSSMAEGPAPPPHKNGGGFLKQAGRTFSFGNKKASLPTIPAEESVPAVPSMPDEYSPGTPRGRSRAETASTTSTATPPKVEDRDFMLDLGGDLSSMLKFDKRASVATLKGLMSNRVSQPAPLNIDNTAPIEPPQHSWNSQHSNDGLLSTGRTLTSPPAASEPRPPPVPRHHTTPLERRRSDEDDEDTVLLRDSIAATQFLSNEVSGPSSGSTRYRRDEEDELSELRSNHADTYSKSSRFGAKVDDDNMFDRPLSRPRFVPRQNNRTNSQPQNKVMTPAEFEKYRQDKAREEIMGLNDDPESDKEEEDNYDDDEDEREKTRQLAKQRKKQEAHMTVYRQQMMKVTGESGNASSNANTNANANTSSHASHPSISLSMSTPNLVLNDGPTKGVSPSPPSDGSESDEEVPLAILAAHGFPNKNRPPTRLTTMSSNPNLRASVQQPSYVGGPGSVVGDNNGANGGHLPPFARKLPQDPYLGAGLINQPPRESFALGGGVAASNPPVPTGGLVGVIANEERSRAMRRGSPALDNTRNIQANGMRMNAGFDPINGIPPQMMYPMGMPQMPNQMPTASDQMQMQMSQQMQQFMQMQMQFMQMMADRGQGQGQGQEQMQGSLRPQGHMPAYSMGSLGDMPRNSFMGDMMGNNMMGNSMGNGMSLDLPRGDNQMRTMSMVQPSSASWLQPPQNGGYAPSIRAQGQGYAPSIAPSERSNIGLPGRYRPVSSVTMLDHGRTSSMSGALPTLHSKLQAEVKVSPMNNKEDDDDDEQGWEAMKAKREKKKSMWRSKKTFGDDIGALIN